jgi:hypothetical protein
MKCRDMHDVLRSARTLHSMERAEPHAVWIGIVEEKIGKLSDRQWQAMFGISVAVINFIWLQLAVTDVVEPIHLLWAIYYLRQYPTWDVMGAMWRVHPVTLQKAVWPVINSLAASLNFIEWSSRLQHPPFRIGNYSVYGIIDGKFCPIEVNRREWDIQSEYYSGKHKRWGLKYEIVVSWTTGQILWIAGGRRGATHDLELARNSGIRNLLLLNEALVGDKGYIGEDTWIFTPFKGRSVDLTLNQRVWNKFLNPRRVLVENALSRICKFQILCSPFRGGNEMDDRVALHHRIMKVVVNLAFLDIEENPLRRDSRENPYVHFRDPDSDEEDDDAGIDVEL